MDLTAGNEERAEVNLAACRWTGWDESPPVFTWRSSSKSQTITGCISWCHGSLLKFLELVFHLGCIFFYEAVLKIHARSNGKHAKLGKTVLCIWVCLHCSRLSVMKPNKKNKQTLRSRPLLQVWPGQWRHQHSSSFIGQPYNRKTIVKHVLLQSTKCICNKWVSMHCFDEWKECEWRRDWQNLAICSVCQCALALAWVSSFFSVCFCIFYCRKLSGWEEEARSTITAASGFSSLSRKLGIKLAVSSLCRPKRAQVYSTVQRLCLDFVIGSGGFRIFTFHSSAMPEASRRSSDVPLLEESHCI